MDQQTVETYDAFARGYDQETADFWAKFPHVFITKFSKSLPRGGVVLDAGSGPGRDAELLRGEGLHLVCLDASAAMVRLTEQKGFTSIQGDLLSLPFPDSHFAGVWAYTSLIHLPRGQVAQAVAEIARVISPQGVLGLGVIEGESNEALKTTELVPAPRLFTYFSLPELGELLEPYFTISYTGQIQPNRRRYLHVVASKK